MNDRQKPFLEALHDFLCMARNRRQALVIRYFLEIIIRRSELCQDGSILVLAAENECDDRGSLLVWSLDDDHVNSLEELRRNRRSLPLNDGIASMALRKRAPEYAPLAEEHPAFRFLPGESTTEIGEIYCVPILSSECGGEPFGVAAFHNRKGSNRRFDEQARLQMDLAVKALEAMLIASPLKLVDRQQVFIVHGRNERVRAELEALLQREKIRSVVVQAKARTGADLLATIEEQIHSCIAGFILLTPDDEGRLYQFGHCLRQRARQNVIFEAGFLTALFRRTGRVCFVKEGDLEIPSDLNGLLMETYGERIDEERIQAVLQRWGLTVASPAPGPDPAAGPGSLPADQSANGAAPAEWQQAAAGGEPGA
jgi:predicted nucleotide-binding protein